jgi:hypothetical protein
MTNFSRSLTSCMNNFSCINSTSPQGVVCF